MASCSEALEAQVSRIESPRSIAARAGTALRFKTCVPEFGKTIYSRARIQKLAPDQCVAGKMGPYRVMLRFVVTALFSLLLAILLPGSGAGGQNDATEPHKAQVSVYVFFSTGCPHCARALGFLTRLSEREPRMHLVPFALSGDARHAALFAELSQSRKIEPPAVPLIIVGDAVYVGYGDDTTSGAEIEAQVKACFVTKCADPTAALLSRHGLAAVAAGAMPTPPYSGVKRPPLPETVKIPGFGEVQLKTLSLPVLTVLLGGIDGFNPCALWVLVFLIGLLMGMKDPLRMWTYGIVFLFTSGAIYFVFLAAWLNIFLFLGALAWLQFSVGLFALTAGVWYLAEFWRNPDAVCKVTTPGSQQKLMDRMRAAVAEPSFGIAVLSIMALAIVVNMIELLCSAGIPAVYTQVLAMSDLNPLAYYGYLLLYIAVFMMDDVLVFVIAMVTLRQAGLVGTYARYSHLIGGGVLLIVGGLLLFRPDLLAFS